MNQKTIVDMKSLSPAQADFIRNLERARDKHTSTQVLADVLTRRLRLRVDRRSIQHWLIGKGPFKQKMDLIAAELVKILGGK